MQENDGVADYKTMEEFDRKYAYKVMFLLASLVMVVMYIEGMLTPSLPTIVNDFKITTSQASLILSLYMVGGVAATPIVGKLGDLFGKKKMMVIVLGIYAVAVSVTGFSPTFSFMIISRAIQGVGMAIMPLGFALVREEFPKELVPKAQAIISAMFGAGFAVSLPLGSFVSDYYTWRWTYHSAIPFVVALAVIASVVIKESRFRRPDVRIDYVGATLLASVLSMFVFALSEGTTWGWTSTLTLGLLLAGTILSVPLTLYELRYTRKGGDAILNFRLLSMKNVMVANIVLTIAGVGMLLSMYALTFRFQYVLFAGQNNEILKTGLSLIPFAAGTIVFGPIAGSLVSRTGVKPLAVLGAVLTAVGFLLQATLPSYYGVMLYEFITGAGLSLLNGTLINFIVLTVNPRDMGLATAMNGTFRSLGSSIGSPVAGSILSTFVIANTTFPSNTAYYYAFLVGAIVFLAAALVIPFGKEVLGRKARKTSAGVMPAKKDFTTAPE